MAGTAHSLQTRGLKVPHYAKSHRTVFSYSVLLSSGGAAAAATSPSSTSFASSACQKAGDKTQLSNFALCDVIEGTDAAPS